MNYAKMPFNFIMESTNDYLIQPTVNVTNDYLIQPTLNATQICAKGTTDFVDYRVIKPCKGILKIKETNNQTTTQTTHQTTHQTTQTLIEPVKFVRFNDIIEPPSSSSLKSKSSVNELSDEELGCIKCYHLKENKQTYFEHLSESLSYSGQAFKASFYFLIHAFVPDLFKYNGSATVYSLTDTIKNKYESTLEETVSSTYDE
jgi:hypothetical protein